MWIAALSLLLLAPADNDDGAALRSAAGSADVDVAARLQALEAQVQALQKRVEQLEARPRAPSYDEPQEKAWTIPVGSSPTLGSGSVDLVVFTDFQCPFCSRVHPLLLDIVSSPQLKGRVRLVYKNYPLSFHANAKPAALMAMAVRDLGGDAAFWKFVDLCYANQRALSSEDLSRYAQQAGVNAGKAEKLLAQNGPRYEGVLADDKRLAEQIKVRGTPQLFVGGWELKQRSLDGVLTLMKEKNL